MPPPVIENTPANGKPPKWLSGADRFLLAIGTVMVVAGGAALLDGRLIRFVIPRPQTNQTQFGAVVTAKQDARQRLSTELIWNPALAGQGLFVGDTLLTGDEGQMLIALEKNRGEILFGPGSIARLESADGIDLSSGNISLTLNNTKIKVGDVTIDSTGGKSAVNVQTGEDGVRLSGLSGKTKIESGGKILELGENQNLIKTADGLRVDADAIFLRQPAAGAVFWPTSREPVVVSWSKPAPGSTDVIELSLSPEFKRIQNRWVTREDRFNLPAELNPGTYHLRISNLDDRVLKLSRPVHIFINSRKPLALLRPAPDSILRFSGTIEAADAVFEWELRPGIPAYTIQIARDRDFSQLSASQGQLTQNTFATTFNSPGKYFWRVKTDESAPVPLEWSAVRTFTIATGSEAASSYGRRDPLVPVLKDALITRNAFETGLTAIELAWSPVTGSVSYAIEIAREPSFSQAEFIRVSSTSAPWKPKNEGNFYWRVRSVPADNAVRPWSDTGEIIFKSRGPVLTVQAKQTQTVDHPAALEKAGPPIQIAWHYDRPSASFRVELGRDPLLKGAQTQVLSGTRAQFPVREEGVYYTRVTALSGRKKDLSLPSGIESISYERKLHLNIPVQVSPADKIQVVAFTGQTQPVDFTWKSVNHAKLYRLQAARDSNFTDLMVDRNVVGLIYKSKELAAGRHYFWRIRAERGPFVSEWSPVRVLTLGNSK